MELRPLDRESITDAELADLTELVNLLEPTARFGDPIPAANVLRQLSVDSAFRSRKTWAARHDGRLVAIAQLEGATRGENVDACDVSFGVHPARRRNGHGRAVLRALQEFAADDGRRIIHPWLELTPESRGFFDAVGFDLVFDERISRVDLRAVDGALMQSWIDRAGDRASRYHLDRWVGRCPESLLDAYVDAAAGMNEAPAEGLVYEKPTYSPDLLRDRESCNEQSGHLEYVILAVETATGRGAGYTSVHVIEDRLAHGEQWDTTTLPAHRQRGLGRWMKAAMWQWIREEHPEVHYLETGNADSNEAMLAINIAMGYEPAYHFGGWQHPDVTSAD